MSKTPASALDTDYLEIYYDNDPEYAAEMFEIFLEEQVPSFYSLAGLIENKKWEKARALLHKLKPSFPMVGLKSFEGALQEIMQCVKNTDHQSKALQRFEKVKASFEVYIPVLKNELSILKKSIQN
jgi:HPt (histidine-containing phosphotransfer) domain-containing protein